MVVVRTSMDALDYHTALNMAMERKAGKSWEQIARRFLFVSGEEAKGAYFRWQHRNNTKVVD